MSLTLTWGTWGVKAWILAEPRSPCHPAESTRKRLKEAARGVVLALASLSLAWRSKSSHMLCSLWATGISHLKSVKTQCHSSFFFGRAVGLPRMISDFEVLGRTCRAART